MKAKKLIEILKQNLEAEVYISDLLWESAPAKGAWVRENRIYIDVAEKFED